MHKKGCKAVQKGHAIPPSVLDDESSWQLFQLVVNNDLERLRECLDSLIPPININSVVPPDPKYKKISLLFGACELGHLEVVKVLVLNYACNVNQGRSDGATPLFLACQENHLQIVQFLLDHGADPNRAALDTFAPLRMAAHMGHSEVVKVLVDHGADVNQGRSDGATPLHLACLQNHLQVVQFLLDHCADVNKAVSNGVTPLMVAACQGHYDLTRLLKSYGADPTMVDNDNETAVQYAQAGNHPDIAQWLTTTSSYSTLYAAIDARCQGAVLKALKDGAGVYDSNNEYNKTALAVARTASLSGKPVDKRIVKWVRLAMRAWSFDKRHALRTVFPPKWFVCAKLVSCIPSYLSIQLNDPDRVATYSEVEHSSMIAAGKLSPELWRRVLSFAGRDHFNLEF